MTSLLSRLLTTAKIEDRPEITDMLKLVVSPQAPAPSTNFVSERLQRDKEGSTAQRSKQNYKANTKSSFQREQVNTVACNRRYKYDEKLTSDPARKGGFIGKSSELQWLRAAAMVMTDRADNIARQTESQRSGFPRPDLDQVYTYNFWAHLNVVKIDTNLNPYELPRPEVASRLSWCYLARVQDSFPIISHVFFEELFRTSSAALDVRNALQHSPEWHITLNLMLAIGARYSHLTEASWVADECDHPTYLARAQAFGRVESSAVNDSDVQHPQNLGLLAFYWLSIGQVDR